MHYILESGLVGLYSLLLYFVLALFVNNFLSLSFSFSLFALGFFKHFLGYFLNIHTFYCNNGYACNKINRNKKIYTAFYNIPSLVAESILEGILFLVFGYFIYLFIKTKFLITFIIGTILHILSEWLSIHDLFCKNHCINV